MVLMRRPFPQLAALLSCFMVAACARGDAATSLGHVTVDTLPHGVLRTMTQAPVGWRDTLGWKLVEVARITGGTEGPGELIDPQDVTIGGDGAIYIADNSPAVIKKYAPDGSFLHTIGHEGAGPGEFNATYLSVHAGVLLVHDPRLARASAFDTSGKFLRSWITVCCFYGSYPTDSGGAIGLSTMAPRDSAAGDHQPYDHLVRWYRPDSTLIDTVLVPSGPEVKRWVIRQGKNGIMSTTIPWVPGQHIAFLPDRRMLVGYAASYQVAVTRDQGKDTTALFGREWTAVPISDAMRKAEVERRVRQTSGFVDTAVVRNAFQLSDVPTTAPAYDWLDIDGAGDTWVRIPVPGDSSRSLFDVFDAQHRWLGQVSGSRFLRSWSLKLEGDRVTGFGEDEEGNPVVVVYRIERGR